MAGSSIEIVYLESRIPCQSDVVSQRDVIDEFSALPFKHVNRPYRIPNPVLSVPHEIIGIHVGMFVKTPERTFTKLERKLIVLGNGVRSTHTPLVARDIVPKLRTEIEIDRRTVVFVTTNTHHLLSSREGELLGGLVVEV